jgi:predicted DNA-binding mobile mystery protein A
MNRKDNQLKHLKLITEQTRPDMNIHAVNRPTGGWLHTVRQAQGLSLKSVAEVLKLSPQAIHQVEKSEANGTISLKQLEAVAGAMDCRLVYVLIPRREISAEPTVTQVEPESRRVQPANHAQEGPGAEFPMALR